MRTLALLMLGAVVACSPSPTTPKGPSAAGDNDEPERMQTCGTLVGVAGVEGWGVHRTTSLLVRDPQRRDDPVSVVDETLVAVRGALTVRQIEQRAQIVFDDHVGATELPTTIELCARGSQAQALHDGERAAGHIINIQSVQVRSHGEPIWIDRDELFPSCPPADRLHRYVSSPVDPRDPQSPSFRLYYELDDDFAPDRPTVMVPADAQQSGNWVGRANAMKSLLGLEDFNIVVFQHRGSFCSRFGDSIDLPPDDWRTAYHWFRIENTVEDMEAVRRDLLGNGGQMLLWGCSGVATTAAAYLKKYHAHVPRAVLGSFYLDPTVASEGAVDVFGDFLRERNLEAAWTQALTVEGVQLQGLLHIVQRLLYSDRDAAAQLIVRLSQGVRAEFDRLAAQPGFDVHYFVRSAQLDWPASSVFMFESNVATDRDPVHDINAPVLAIGDPVARVAASIGAQRWSRAGLEEVSTEVLLFAGTQDHATPITETRHIHRMLPRSRLALFDAYHCLADTQCKYGKSFAGAFLRDGVLPQHVLQTCGGRWAEAQ